MVDWAFIRFAFTAFVTTIAGAQVIHLIYRPLDDLEELTEKEFQKRIQYIKANKQSETANLET